MRTWDIAVNYGAMQMILRFSLALNGSDVTSTAQLFFFFFFCLFVFFVVVAISWATSAAYGGSQARG